MGTIIGYEANFGFFSFELSLLGGIIFVIVLALYILAAYDGMKFVFRGTRDYMSLGHETPTIFARLGGTVAALFLLFSGGAIFVAILGWVAGAGFFTQKPTGPIAKVDKQMAKLEGPQRSKDK